MNPNTQGVPFGTKQKFLLTPKPGYEIDSVTVLNTTTGEEFSATLERVSENPPQWSCSFDQPAGVVRLITKTKPIMYSVIIEDCENCSIVLVEDDEAVQVEAQVVNSDDSQVSEPEEQEGNEPSEENNSTETQIEDEAEAKPSNFKKPQRSFKGLFNTKKVLNVEDDEENNKENSNVVEDVLENEIDEEKTPDGPKDEVYDPGEFAAELEDVEPTYVSRAIHEKRCNTAWNYRENYSAGKISKEKYEEVLKKHTDYLNDINAGKIIIQD